MRIAISRRGRTETVAIFRQDGTEAHFTVPSKGPVPHDAFHFFIESQLALPTAFWGRIARGEDPDAIQAIAEAGGHASARRAARPDPAIVELLQAERLVEAFEAESWSGAADDDGLMAMARSGWESSQVPPLPMKAGDLAAIRRGIADFGERWAAAAEGEAIMLDWRNP